VLSFWRRLAGGNRIGFDNATYLSELRHADRNFALAYFMVCLVAGLLSQCVHCSHSLALLYDFIPQKDAGAFDPETVRTSEQLQSHLEFYFQCCSILANTDDMASVAATLANGGVHPTTAEYVLTRARSLSLTLSIAVY
jgi:glutaminase